MSNRLVQKLRDRDLVNALQKVADSIPEKDPKIAYFDLFKKQLSDAELSELKELNSYEIRSATLSFENCKWTVSRQEDPQFINLDKINVTFNGRSHNEGYLPDDKLIFFKTSALFSEKFSRPLASTLDTPEGLKLQSHQLMLNELESVASKLIYDTDEHRRRLDHEHIQNELRRQEHFDTSTAEIRKNYEEEKQRHEMEYAKRQSLLDERENDLNELKKKLDDRDNTHVRREIRSSLLALTKERLENYTISGTTKRQYYAVNTVSIMGLFILAFASFQLGAQISVDPETKRYPTEAIALMIKSTSLAAAAVALGSWYLGWLNRWLQRIADTEFKLQQFRLDIERASWLAETVLEWKSSSPEPFPELLATRLSAGLFQSQGSDADDPRTPASHLAEALLGSASSAKLRLGENEVNFDRKAIQRLDE